MSEALARSAGTEEAGGGCGCKCNCKCKNPVEPGSYIERRSAPGRARPPDLDSVVRILRVSGRRLVDCGGEWRVLPRGDRRTRALMLLD